MNIGFTYCAGCKAQNKDIAVYEELLKYLLDLGASFANCSSDYDYIFCISGCGCRCCSVEGFHYIKKVFHVDRSLDRETFEKIKKEIEGRFL